MRAGALYYPRCRPPKPPNRGVPVHTLTREQDPHRHGAAVRAGRVSTALLREGIPEPTACRVFACGPAITVWDRKVAKETGAPPPPRFLESALASLLEIGVRSDQITRESYG